MLLVWKNSLKLRILRLELATLATSGFDSGFGWTKPSDDCIIYRQISEQPITDVINVPTPIKCALLVRWGRKQKHLTQAQLAEELDMTQSQIAKIESAANGVTAEVLGKLAKALDVTFTITPNDPVLGKTSPKKAS